MKSEKRTLIVFLLITSLSFSLLGPVVISSQEFGDENINGQIGGPSENNPGQIGPGGQDNTQNSQSRYQYQVQEMTIEGEGNCTRIRSRYGEAPADEMLDIFFSIDTAPVFLLSFSSTQIGNTNEQHFRLIVERLIEYIDRNANGQYDNNDAVVSTIDFSNVTFANITYTSTITSEGGRMTIIRTNTLDDLFGIVIYVTDKKTSFMNSTITPKEIKFDFNIRDYPFMNQASQLALQSLVETPFTITTQQRTYDQVDHDNLQESKMNITSSSRNGFFSWVNNAIVDNVSKPVNVAVISKTEQTFYEGEQSSFTQAQVIFSYARGKNILHDPKIGVFSVLGTILPSVLQVEYLSVIYLIACLISGVVFYGVIHYRKKV